MFEGLGDDAGATDDEDGAQEGRERGAGELGEGLGKGGGAVTVGGLNFGTKGGGIRVGMSE